MGRAIWIHLAVAIGSVLVVGSASGQAPPQSESRTSIRRADVPLVIKAVEEWETIPIEQAGLPQVGADEVLAKARDWLKAFEKLTSWEARYETTSVQGGPSPVRTGTRFHTISDGRKWYSRQQDKSPDSGQSQPWEAACDGNTVRTLRPDKKQAEVHSAREHMGWGSAPTLPGFFPQIPADAALRYGPDLPRLSESLNESGIRLLPVCTRVNEHACYILERTVREELPVFRSVEERVRWDKEHKDERLSTDGSIPVASVIYPMAKPEDKISRAITTRLAVDPKLDFAVVRWAVGYEVHWPGRDLTVFPHRELICQDFRQVAEGVQMPFQVECRLYHATVEGRREVYQQSSLALESFVVQPAIESGLFAPALPAGYTLYDDVRGIIYKIGDPQSKIDRLLAAAQARDAFYRQLRDGPAPALQGSAWIESDVINLAEHKGRPIVLYFWAITCGPCMQEMPHLQAQYGNTLKSTEGPLFIAIHSTAEGADVEKVRQVVRSRGITFPVMIDAPPARRPFMGTTFRTYRVLGTPHTVRIDENGRVGEVEEEMISESSWWANEGRDK